jgi:hypothetical protein
MEAKIYGIIDNNGCIIDVSKTEKGCKRYATLNGHTLIGYRVGYNGFITHEKIGKKWRAKN